MPDHHKLENQNLHPTTSDQVEEVSEKEEEKELENEELKAVAGGAAPPEDYINPIPYQSDPAEPAPPPPDDPISDLETLVQSVLPGG